MHDYTGVKEGPATMLLQQKVSSPETFFQHHRQSNSGLPSYVQTSQLHQLCSKTLMWQAQELYVCPVKVLVCTSGWRALFPNLSIIGTHMQTCWIPGDIIMVMSSGLNSVLCLKLLELRKKLPKAIIAASEYLLQLEWCSGMIRSPDAVLIYLNLKKAVNKMSHSSPAFTFLLIFVFLLSQRTASWKLQASNVCHLQAAPNMKKYPQGCNFSGSLHMTCSSVVWSFFLVFQTEKYSEIYKDKSLLSLAPKNLTSSV